VEVLKLTASATDVGKEMYALCLPSCLGHMPCASQQGMLKACAAHNKIEGGAVQWVIQIPSNLHVASCNATCSGITWAGLPLPCRDAVARAPSLGMSLLAVASRPLPLEDLTLW